MFVHAYFHVSKQIVVTNLSMHVVIVNIKKKIINFHLIGVESNIYSRLVFQKLTPPNIKKRLPQLGVEPRICSLVRQKKCLLNNKKSNI